MNNLGLLGEEGEDWREGKRVAVRQLLSVSISEGKWRSKEIKKRTRGHDKIIESINDESSRTESKRRSA